MANQDDEDRMHALEDDMLLNENLMPNDGEAFADPVQKAEIDEQMVRDRAAAIGAEPLINDIFSWLNFEIGRADSIDNINPAMPISVESQMAGMKHYKQQMILLKTSLVNLMDRFEVPFDSESTGKEAKPKSVG